MSNSAIHPHPGQTVLYYALEDEVYEGNKLGESGIPAIVTQVWSDDCINLELITGPCKGMVKSSVCHIESEFPGVSGWHNVDGDLIVDVPCSDDDATDMVCRGGVYEVGIMPHSQEDELHLANHNDEGASDPCGDDREGVTITPA